MNLFQPTKQYKYNRILNLRVNAELNRVLVGGRFTKPIERTKNTVRSAQPT